MDWGANRRPKLSPGISSLDHMALRSCWTCLWENVQEFGPMYTREALEYSKQSSMGHSDGKVEDLNADRCRH